MNERKLQEQIVEELNACAELAAGGAKAFVEDQLSLIDLVSEHLLNGVALVVVTPDMTRSGSSAEGIPATGPVLVQCEEVRDTLEIIPSLYLLTHDPREVFRGNIIDLAMAWADEQPVGAIAAIKAACDKQMVAVMDVIPEAGQKLQKSMMKLNFGEKKIKKSPQIIHIVIKIYV